MIKSTFRNTVPSRVHNLDWSTLVARLVNHDERGVITGHQTILDTIKNIAIPAISRIDLAGDYSASNFMDKFKLQKGSLGVDPNILSATINLFTSFKPGLKITESGLIVNEQDKVSTSPALISRSKFIAKQSDSSTVVYSTGVPFIPYIYKLYNNVNYTDWQIDTAFQKIVGADLATVVPYIGYDPDYFYSLIPESFIKYINLACYYKIKNSDRPNKAADSTLAKATLERIADFARQPIGDILDEAGISITEAESALEAFESFPRMLKLMLLNRWIFKFDNEYLIKNPVDWDNLTPIYNTIDDNPVDSNTYVTKLNHKDTSLDHLLF